MHIDSITLINFRNFLSTSIAFSKGFQTIIGENNVGKSNLLYAMRLSLDKNMSFNARILSERDFYNYPEISFENHIIISISFYGEDLANLPCFHAIKTGNNSMRITYVFAHKSVLCPTDDTFDECKMSDFMWRLYGGEGLDINDFAQRDRLSFNDLDGLNLNYIHDFRNIYRDLMGNDKSLLRAYP